MPFQSTRLHTFDAVPEICTARAAWMGWAASLLDAEGSIRIAQRHRRRAQVRGRGLDVNITQQDREVLEWVCAVVGIYAPIHRIRRGRHRPRGFVLSFTGADAALLLVRLMPYLALRQQEARQAVNAWINPAQHLSSDLATPYERYTLLNQEQK